MYEGDTLMPFLAKARAFIVKDFRVESSYKAAYLFDLVSMILPLVLFYFIARLVDSGNTQELARYGGKYFPFVLVGVAFAQYFTEALRTFSATVRRAQTAGVLEAMLSSRTSTQAVILYTSLYSFLYKTIHLFLVFIFGALMFGIDYSEANYVTAAVTIICSIAAFSGIGIISATLIVVLKKGDPIELLIGSAGTLLGGAFFPIEIMPGWMQWIAKLLPITYALEAMRMGLFAGKTVRDLWLPLTVLGGMAAVLLPLSLWSFSWAVGRARKDGTLTHH